MAIRSFLAIDTPQNILPSIVELQRKLMASNADVRWEPPEKMHVTIKFLGNVEERKLPEVIESIAKSLMRLPPFEIRYRGVGCFPSLHRPRVIWIGCENEDGTLLGIKNAVDEALLPHGFEKEERAFHPHITLGRVKSPRGIKNLTPLLETVTFETPPWRCNHIHLMRSILKPQGSEHLLIRSFFLQ